MATIVDCWSCKNTTPGDPDLEEESEMLDHRIFLLDESINLLHQQRQQQQEQQKNRGVNRWLRSVCSILQTSSGSRDEQRKCAWNCVIESLMQRHPGSQLPDRLISTVRRHFHSLPLSYAQAGFGSEQVFTHIRLIDQARADHTGLAASIQSATAAASPPASPVSWDEEDEEQLGFTVAFAVVGAAVSKQAVCWAFKRAGVRVRQAQIFERKALALGSVSVVCERELMDSDRALAVLASAVKKCRLRTLALGFYGDSKSSSGSSVLIPSRRSNAEIESRVSFSVNRLSSASAHEI